MTLFEFDCFGLLAEKTHLRPSTAIGFALSSILAAFLYAIFLDFTTSYVKEPKHFLPRGWLVTFEKPKVKAPLVELQDKGDYRELLERGSRMASALVYTLAIDE